MKSSPTVKLAKRKGISIKEAIKLRANANGYRLNRNGFFEPVNN